jgi:hypothetical protein
MMRGRFSPKKQLIRGLVGVRSLERDFYLENQGARRRA